MDQTDRKTQNFQTNGSEPENRQRKVRYWGSWIAIILGVALMTEAAEIPRNGITGLLMVFCALAYMARKHQMLHISIRWKIIEIISLLLTASLFLLAILSLNVNDLYFSPISETEPFIVVIWTITAYIFLIRKYRRNGREEHK